MRTVTVQGHRRRLSLYAPPHPSFARSCIVPFLSTKHIESITLFPGKAMKIDRLFTQAAKDPYASLEFESRSSVIRNPDGSVVAEWKDVQVPKTWSQVASDIMAQKYFRKAGIPKHRRKRSEEGVPSWLQTSARSSQAAKLPADEKMVSENDARQVFDRLPDAGRTGDTMATSMMSLRARLSMTSFATCSPIKWWHLTLHSGSTPA